MALMQQKIQNFDII
jgi:hypothetical protein